MHVILENLSAVENNII